MLAVPLLVVPVLLMGEFEGANIWTTLCTLPPRRLCHVAGCVRANTTLTSRIPLAWPTAHLPTRAGLLSRCRHASCGCVCRRAGRADPANAMTLAVFRLIGAARLGTGIAAHEISSSLLFWALLSVTGLCGGLINISTFLAIKLTSPLSFLITGISKVTDGLSACARVFAGLGLRVTLSVVRLGRLESYQLEGGIVVASASPSIAAFLFVCVNVESSTLMRCLSTVLFLRCSDAFQCDAVAIVWMTAAPSFAALSRQITPSRAFLSRFSAAGCL